MDETPAKTASEERPTGTSGMEFCDCGSACSTAFVRATDDPRSRPVGERGAKCNQGPKM